MKNGIIGRLLNHRFECPACLTPGNWRATARAMVRVTSTIQAFQCRYCGEEVFAKVPRTASGASGAVKLAQDEFRMLRQLQTIFPQNSHFGTLVPLGYLEFDDYAVMITRKFDGVNLIEYVSRLGADQLRGVFRPAGVLLRQLHDSCPEGYKPQILGVENKIEYLAQTYGTKLRSTPATRTVFDRFEEEAGRIGQMRFRATWNHGDFKPENVLCDGHRYVMLDNQLGGYGVFTYDIASFLNHLLIAGQSARGSGITHVYPQAEEEFLAGYGGVNQQELAALRWTQLYFMLHYWGRYCQRGRLTEMYANWKIRPLAQKLGAQL